MLLYYLLLLIVITNTIDLENFQPNRGFTQVLIITVFIRIILLIPKVERPGLEPGLRDYQSRLLTVWRIAQYKSK